MISLGCFSSPILKFSTLRWVWAPQRRSAGTATSPIFTLNVTAPVPVPPVITAPTADKLISILDGETAAMSITAEHAASYQWQKWNGTQFVNIDGATGAAYTTPTATAADHNAKFRCIATNADGSATSPTFTLEVKGYIPKITAPTAKKTVNVYTGTATTLQTTTATLVIRLRSCSRGFWGGFFRGGVCVWGWGGRRLGGS